jgi:hypothetical protein
MANPLNQHGGGGTGSSGGNSQSDLRKRFGEIGAMPAAQPKGGQPDDAIAAALKAIDSRLQGMADTIAQMNQQRQQGGPSQDATQGVKDDPAPAPPPSDDKTSPPPTIDPATATTGAPNPVWTPDGPVGVEQKPDTPNPTEPQGAAQGHTEPQQTEAMTPLEVKRAAGRAKLKRQRDAGKAKLRGEEPEADDEQGDAEEKPAAQRREKSGPTFKSLPQVYREIKERKEAKKAQRSESQSGGGSEDMTKDIEELKKGLTELKDENKQLADFLQHRLPSLIRAEFEKP